VVLVVVGAVTVDATVPENTVCAGGVTVEVVTTTVRDGTVKVEAGDTVVKTTMGEA
jgi:hypothetical protein